MKHTWKVNKDGSIDEFAYNSEGAVAAGLTSLYCNGPECAICGFTFCEHCNPELWNDDTCPGKIDAELPINENINNGNESTNDEDLFKYQHHPFLLIFGKGKQYKTIAELKARIISGIQENLL